MDSYICCCCEGSSGRVLAEQGADLNIPTKEGVTPVHMVAIVGQVEVMCSLVELRADMNMVDSYKNSPLMIAVRWDHQDVADLLVNVGADVQQCLQDLALLGAIPLREMMSQFCTRVGLPTLNFSDTDGDADIDVKTEQCCRLFSLSKLLSGACLNLRATDDHTNAYPYDEISGSSAHQLLEANIAIGMRHQLSTAVMERMSELCYVLKRRLVLIGGECSSRLCF